MSVLVTCGDVPTEGCYASIVEAVAAAAAGDEVWLRAGTYAEAVTIDKDLLVVGQDGHLVTGPSGPGSAFTITGGSVWFEAVVIATGQARALDVSGGAIVEVDDGWLWSSGLQPQGGLVRVVGASFAALDTTFGRATALEGAHVHVTDGALTLGGCALTDGIALGDGGSLALVGATTATVTDTAFEGNEAASSGGAIHQPSGSLTIERSLFCANRAEIGGALAVSSAEAANNRFHANEALQGAAVHVATGTMELRHPHLLVNLASEGVLTVGETGALDLVNALAAWNTGGLVRAEGTFTLDGLVTWQNDGAPTGEEIIEGDPRLWRWDPARPCDSLAWPSWYGAARAGGSAGNDLDGSSADAGAWGGPGADPTAWVDEDADGWPAVYDCDETNDGIHPGADDPPYDGVDVDCDGASDFDGDQDGHEAADYGGDDCDDQDAGVRPGATEIPYDAIDQDCDGLDLVDVDGDGWAAPVDCQDADPTIHPGAVDDDPSVDRDCDGVVGDEARSGCGCSSVPAAPALAWLALVVPFARRRR